MTVGHLYKVYEIMSEYPQTVRNYNASNSTKLRFRPRDQIVLERISFHADKGGVFRYGFRRLAKELCVCEKTIERSFKNLVAVELVKKTKNSGGGLNDWDEETTSTSEWQLLFEPIPSLPDVFGRAFAKENALRTFLENAEEPRGHQDSQKQTQDESDQPAAENMPDDDWGGSDYGVTDLDDMP